MLCGTSALQQLLVNREVFRSKMTPSALVRPTSSSLQGKGRDGAAGTSRHGFKPRDKKLDREEI